MMLSDGAAPMLDPCCAGNRAVAFRSIAWAVVPATNAAPHGLFAGCVHDPAPTAPMSRPFSRLATAKAALLMTGSTYVSFILGLVVSALIARALGAQEFGRYAYVVWISGVLVMMANNGLNTTGIRFIAEGIGRGNPQAAKAVHGWLQRLQVMCLLATVVGFLVTLPLTASAGWSGQLLLFAGVVVASVIAKAIYLFDISVAKGYGHYSVEAYSTMTVSALNLVAVVVLWLLHAPLSAYLIVFAFASAVYAIIAGRLMRARRIQSASGGLGAEFAPRVKAHLMWTVLLAIAAAFGNKSSEIYLLGHHAGPAEVGFFTIAASLTRGGVELLTAGLNSVLMPLMGHAFGAGGTARVNAILADAVRYFSFAGLLLAGVGYLWADVVISLMYGAQYQQATQVFQVMAVVAGLTMSSGAFGALLSTTDHQRLRAFVAVLSVALSILVAVLLVPRYGLLGAVAAHAASSIAIFVLIVGAMVKVFSIRLPWRELTRLTLSAAVASAAAAACIASGRSLLLQFIAGLAYALVFIAASFVFRAWKEVDLAPLLPLSQRYPKLLGRLLPALAGWLRG